MCGDWRTAERRSGPPLPPLLLLLLLPGTVEGCWRFGAQSELVAQGFTAYSVVAGMAEPEPAGAVDVSVEAGGAVDASVEVAAVDKSVPDYKVRYSHHLPRQRQDYVVITSREVACKPSDPRQPLECVMFPWLTWTRDRHIRRIMARRSQ